MITFRTLWLLMGLLFFAAHGVAEDKLRVVGYLPEYRVATIDPTVGKHLTDVVFFSIEPQPDQPLRHPRWETAKPLLSSWKKQHGVRVTMALGGWNRSAGFPKIAATAESRRAFSAAVLKLCQSDELDGVDLDWEYPAHAEQGGQPRDTENFSTLLREFRAAIESER